MVEMVFDTGHFAVVAQEEEIWYGIVEEAEQTRDLAVCRRHNR